MIDEQFALELMRENKPLMCMHTTNGTAWFIVPDGRVSDTAAARIIVRRDVQAGKDGMFPGLDQTFWLRKR
jgi:hypothetical protein